MTAKAVRIDVPGELRTPAGRKALRALLESRGVKVGGVDVLAGALWVRVPGGNLVIRQEGGCLEVVGLGNPLVPEGMLEKLPAVLEALAGVLVQQRVLAAVQRLVQVDQVTRAPNGALVIQAKL
jgi:hypothetical protein